ncbi:hypothetical protein L1049_028168 [Liquidambar formosana]|uniref:C2H2-type domain-containing protein n=1 Tax=Liquidambar formosana TaxID=63359 RepID=A0AAP0RM30_LIQFO
MDNERRGNAMPVELAIQRELAYRKKVEMLQLQPFGTDSWKEFLPLQVPSPSPSPVSSSSLNLVPWPSATSSPCPSPTGIKRKAPTSSLQCLPSQQLQPIDSGLMHKTMSDYYFCKVCQVPCSGPFNFKQHLRGRQHKANMKHSREDGRKQANQQQRCELCEISCMDEYALKLHLNGQKHKAKVLELELGRKEWGGIAHPRRWCELCKLWCMDDYALKQHLDGKKHIMKLHAVRGKKRAEEDEAAGAMLKLKDVEWQMIS